MKIEAVCKKCKKIHNDMPKDSLEKTTYCDCGEKLTPIKSSNYDILAFIIIIALIIWWLSSCYSSCVAKETKAREESRKYGDLIYAKMTCEDKINSVLKAPSTSKIIFETKDGYNGTYSFSGYIDAQNSFGAMIRSRFKARIKHTNGDYKVISFDIL